MNHVGGEERETSFGFPDPLQRGRWFNVGTWAPPATTLSFSSLLVFIGVIIFLQRNAELRLMFGLRFGTGEDLLIVRSLILLAAGLAWHIAFRCRRRPSRWWPRLWTLALAIMATLLAILHARGVVSSRVPLLDASIIACVAAVLVLSLRLLRLHPDSAWMERMTPLSLVLVLIVLGPALLMGEITLSIQRQAVERSIQALSEKSVLLQKCRGSGSCSEKDGADGLRLLDASRAGALSSPLLQSVNETDLRERYENAAAALLKDVAEATADRLGSQIGEGRLKNLSFGEMGVVLAAAKRLNRVDVVTDAYGRLLDGVAEAIHSRRAPTLKMAPVIYNREKENWPKNSQFPKKAEEVSGYYEDTRRLFDELESLAKSDDNAMSPLLDAYHAKLKTWQENITRIDDSWDKHWLLPYLRAPNYLEKPLTEVLMRPVFDDSLAPAQLRHLFALNKQIVEEWVNSGRAANCETLPDEHDERQYFGVRCRAYTGGPDGRQAALRVEMRLVYKSPKSGYAKPGWIYFFFPVPAGRNAEEYKVDVRDALIAAQGQLDDNWDLGDKSKLGEIKTFTQGQPFIEMLIKRWGQS